MSDHTVRIRDVEPDAVRVKAKKLDPNKHGFFNSNGARHRIREVVLTKKWVKTVRDDGWVDFFKHDEKITVWRLTPKR